MLSLNRARGVTLIELMITMGVLAIVASIAIPAYRGYVSTSMQTEGWNNLRSLQVAEEEYFLENNSYFACTNATECNTESGGLWTRAESSDANFEYKVVVTGNTYAATATGQGDLDNSVVLTVTKN